ncbi:MAG TPA: type II toxin-antitoxin system VapC family toxin [Thermoanaerobaculia bacterium]|nr:type II toxin-antitoxin system VapC family toxin [Thermoanaerobaculia bacterium]
MIVADASAILEILLHTKAASALRDRILGSDESLHAPELLDLEVLQVIRRYLQTRDIALPRAEEALRDLADLRLERYPHGILLRRIWQLRQNFTSYDAAYVSLAELLDATLITTDARLAASARKLVEVELFR